MCYVQTISLACHYKWLVGIVYRDGKEDILWESRWFDSETDFKMDFDQKKLKDGYSLPDSFGSREYIIQRREILS